MEVVNSLSDGQLVLEYYPLGAIVEQKEVFDSVVKGVIPISGDAPMIWAGKNTAFDLLESYAMGLTPGDYFVWIWQAGGLELYQELYAKYGLIGWPHCNASMESGLRGNEPMRTAADFEGKKIRLMGHVQGQIVADLGGAQVPLSGAEVYHALERGVIDYGEYCSPAVDWGMGFAEVTKYWAVPGWHQPNALLGIMINEDAWNSLSPHLKEVIKQACMATFTWSWAFYEYGAVEAINKFVEAGTTITHLDQATLDKIQELAWKYMLEDARKNPDYAKIAYSQVKYLHDFATWRSISEPFCFGRNPKGVDEVLAELEALAK